MQKHTLFCWVWNPSSVAINQVVNTVAISGATSECLPNMIMKTCTHSNKVGLLSVIQPRLFPTEIVVCELKPYCVCVCVRERKREGGVVLLGGFLLFAPVILCTWHEFMICIFFLLTPIQSDLRCEMRMPLAYHDVKECVGYGSYVDSVRAALYVITIFRYWIQKKKKLPCDAGVASAK